VLGGGPLVLALLGAPEAAVTVLFITQTAFRAPFLIASAAWARTLPALTRMATAGDHGRLGRTARLISCGAVALAALGAAVAALLGPTLIDVLFSEGVRPGAGLAATLAAATVLAIANLGLVQILVAAARTHRITMAWWAAIGAAALVVLVGGDDELHRVAVAFGVGELVALVGLTLAANMRLAPVTRT